MAYTVRGDKIQKSGSASLEKGNLVQREYVRVLSVVSDVATSDTVEVGNNCGHVVGESYPLDPNALLRKITVRQVGATAWEVTLNYSTGFEEHVQNPLLRPVTRQWSPMELSVPLYYDMDGTRIVNSAGQMFDPGIETELCIGVLTCVRNEAYYNYATALSYANSVNSDSFFGAAAGYVRCRMPAGSEKREDGYVYWEVTYEFHFSPILWNAPVLDQGTMYKDSGGDLVYPSDKDGTKSTNMCFLDGSGGLLPTSDEEAGNYSFLNFKRYKTRAFASLGLG